MRNIEMKILVSALHGNNNWIQRIFAVRKNHFNEEKRKAIRNTQYLYF